jgi:two-component system response regulator FlrC
LTTLTERPRDILPLARRMIERHHRNGRMLPVLTRPAEQRLLAHRWPGNVRELDNVIQRAMILMQGTSIDVEDLRFETATGSVDIPAAATACPATEGPALGENLKSREQRLILDALRAGNGSRKAAAERLGISGRTLRYKLARMRDAGLDIPGLGVEGA